jgi:hypothetical protein
MKPRRLLVHLYLLPLLCFLTGSPVWGAETYSVGSQVAAFTAKDQHGQAYTFKPGVRYLLVSFDMPTGKQANEKLSELGKDYLPQHNAIFLADIHGMPGIGRMFALPKMRKYKHRIILGDQKGLLDPYPRKEGHITVLTLDAEAKVAEVRYWNAERDAVESLLIPMKR